MNTCRNCIYWTALDGTIPALEETSATCRRYPPQNIAHWTSQLKFGYETVFPILKASDDCGEFKSRNPADNQPETTVYEPYKGQIPNFGWVGGPPSGKFSWVETETINRLTKERDEAREHSGGETHRADFLQAETERQRGERQEDFATIGRLEKEARNARDVIKQALGIINRTAFIALGQADIDDFTYKAKTVLEYEPYLDAAQRPKR